VLAEPICLVPVHLPRQTRHRDRHASSEHIQAKAKTCSMETPCKTAAKLFRFCLAGLAASGSHRIFRTFWQRGLATDQFHFHRPYT